MDSGEKPHRFISPLPERGIWTAVGLTRRQFFVILIIATALFVWVGGPIWRHLRTSHFDRIVVSYLVIPALVLAALYRNGKVRFLLLVEATVVIAVVKLLVTALLLVAIALSA